MQSVSEADNQPAMRFMLLTSLMFFVMAVAFFVMVMAHLIFSGGMFLVIAVACFCGGSGMVFVMGSVFVW